MAFLVFASSGALRAQDDAGNELVQLVVTLLHESDKDLRSVAFEQVRTDAPGEAATKVFAGELSKLEGEAQIGLLAALAARGDNAARPEVLKTLDDAKEEATKVAAIDALGALGEAADVDLLAKLVVDPAKPLSTAARGSLVRLPGGQVPGAILLTMKSAPAATQVALLSILAERRALGAIPDIVPYAVVDDKSVRMAAMTALGQIASAEAIPAMIDGILRAEAGPEREAAEKNVMFVCQRIADPEQRAAPIVTTMKALSDDNQRLILSTLGRVGGAAALTIVETAIAAKDAPTHAAGIKALCNWPDVSVAARLADLAQHDDHPEHQIAALRALVRVAPLADSRTDAERLALLEQAMKLCSRDEDRKLVLQRARAIRTVDTLRFVAPYMDQPAFAEMACETVVELAHHRALRDSSKEEFHAALDKVIATSKDPVLHDRSERYKKNQTWVRPKPQ